jgi:hypothetical protein
VLTEPVVKWSSPIEYTRNQFVTFLAKHQTDSKDIRKNTVLVKLTHRDRTIDYLYDYIKDTKRLSYEPLSYMITDGNHNELHYEDIVEQFEKDILQAYKKIKKQNEQMLRRAAYRKKQRQYYFRKGSVPFVTHHKWHFAGYYRSPQIHNAVVNNAEYKEYSAPKYRRKNMPVWDDRPRHIDRSWKNQNKLKKQYMKHKDKHKDTCEISKYEFIDELESLEKEINQ